MNYIIKGLLKKIFTQYLFIKDDGFDLQSGVIKLPSGLINHESINQKLRSLGIKINSSTYKNLIINIPIMQLLSKPIKISIQIFDLVIEKLYEPTQKGDRKQSQSQLQQGQETNIKQQLQGSLQKKEKSSKQEDSKQNSSYFKNIINRLLYNMQIAMQKINVKLLDSREEQDYKQAFFSIYSMNVKNSLVILQANIIKKTFNLGLMHLRHTFGEIQIKDFNICVDYNSKKLSVIAILGNININFYKIPLRKLSKRILRKTSKNELQKEEYKKKQKSQLQLSIYTKINCTTILSKILKIKLSIVEANLKRTHQNEQIRFNFEYLKVKNANQQAQDKDLLFLGYLPLNNQVKIYVQFEDNIIKNSFVSYKKQTQLQNQTVALKIYHLKIAVDINQLKILCDNLLKYEKDIAMIVRLIKKMGVKNQSQQIQNTQKQEKAMIFDLLLYRVLFQILYKEQKMNLYTTAQLKGTLFQPNTQFKGKVCQLGVKLMSYNVSELNELDIAFQNNQILFNSSNLTIQASLALFDKLIIMKDSFSLDLLYYSQKIKKITLPEKTEISHSQQSYGERSDIKEQSSSTQIKLPKIYFKINEILVKLGENSTQIKKEQIQIKKQQSNPKEHDFIAILEFMFVDTLFGLSNNKAKLHTDFISYVYSPYTLQRIPLTNQLQCSLVYNIKSNEFNINFKNNLILLIEDQVVNIIYKLLDKREVWTQFKNLTHQHVVFVQQAPHFSPLIKPQLSSITHQSYRQMYYHKIEVQPFKNSDLFWRSSSEFRITVGNKRSETIVLNKSQQLQSDPKMQYYQLQKQLKLQNNSQCLYVLKIIYNRLGNICDIILDYKYHIVSYFQDFEIVIHGNSYPIQRDPQYINNKSVGRAWDCKWFHKLEDLMQDYQNVTIKSKECEYKLEMLMANQEFSILGLTDKQSKKKDDKAVNIYSSYILQLKKKSFYDFTLMPFLIIRNEFEFDLQIQIIDKKSQQKEVFRLPKGQTKNLNKNQFFDFYMKQFIIKICILNQQSEPLYQSDFFYFNTYFMVNQKTQTSIQLRSLQRQSYKKKLIVFQEGLILKTRRIILKNGMRFNNNTIFRFLFRIKQNSKQQTVECLSLEPKQNKEWSCKMKRDTKIQVMINGHLQNKIEILYTNIREPKILSFNFCKLNDKYYNILVKIQSRVIQGIEQIQIQDFVQLVNLCQFVPQIQVQDLSPIKNNQKTCLPLNATSLSKYNNKALQIDDIHKIYAEIFLTAKVTDDPLKIILAGNSVALTQIIKQNSKELMVGADRYVFTLLKDMNYNRLTFYLTDKIYSKTQNYTIMNNTSSKHFLLTDDSEYLHHFIIEKEVDKSAPPQKIFVKKQSFNCFVNKENCDILFCDEHQKHLQKIDKKLLQRQGLKLQHYQFQSITLIDCSDQEKELQVKRQISTKGIEVRIKMFKKVELTMSIKALTVRLLQKNKLDVLIQDISIKNQQNKDHLLRIPQETYILLQAKMLNKGHFLLVKNLFIKCKHIIVNIRRQMPYSFVNLMNILTQRMGFNFNTDQQQNMEPRKYIQKLKKMNGEIKLKQCLNQMLLLIKNVYIHEIHLSLTIQLQNLSFSNVIILSQYEISNKFARQKSLKNEIVVYYLTNLLAKFPKLSFLMANFKNPFNAIKLFFNIRQAIKQKIQAQHIICFGHKDIPNTPFCFSIQRWNHILSKMHLLDDSKSNNKQKMITFIQQDKKYLILTNYSLLWVEEGESHPIELKQLQNIRLLKNRVSCEMIIRMKNGQKLTLIEQYKKCSQLLYHIKQLIM